MPSFFHFFFVFFRTGVSLFPPLFFSPSDFWNGLMQSKLTVVVSFLLMFSLADGMQCFPPPDSAWTSMRTHLKYHILAISIACFQGC